MQDTGEQSRMVANRQAEEQVRAALAAAREIPSDHVLFRDHYTPTMW